MFKSIWDDVVYQFRRGNTVMILIWICIVVFLIFETVRLAYWSNNHDVLYYDQVYKRFALPMSFSRLIWQPWSLISFMFMHNGLGHIFFNMLCLYWFGEIYNLYMRDKRSLELFIFGSLIGAFLAMIGYHILPPLRPGIDSSSLVGASAGILAIMFAATAINPEHRVRVWFIGEVAIKYVSVVLFLISFIGISGGNAGGEIAHVGGSLFGYLYIKALQSGTDWFAPLDRIAALFKPKSKLKATYVNTGKAKKDGPSDNEQKRLDQILDKIAKSGYSSLSKEEKDFLFKFSNK
jgi:membrane associated rhomboid family serine protease